MAKKKIGDIVDQLYALRADKGKLSAQLRELEQQEKTLEEEFFSAVAEQGIDQARGKTATVSISRNTIPTCKDWDALGKWAIRHKAPQIFQRRLAVDAVRELLETFPALPGVEMFEKTTLNVRKI
jgi:hypothetical protein